MRAVLDTNVILSGLLWTGTPKKCLDEYRVYSTFQIILSPELVNELRTKLTDKFKIPKVLAQKWESEITQYAHLTVPQLETNICRDTKDNMILDTAISGKAKYIVSGDKDLLSLKKFRSIPIVTPRQFLEVIKIKTQNIV